MGEFTISTSMTIFVWLVSVGVIGINLFIVGGFLVDEGNSSASAGGWIYASAAFSGLLYLGFILFLMWEDLLKLKRRARAFFVKLGGYDVVGRYGSHPSADNGVDDGNSGGRPHRVPLQDEEDGGDSKPLAPGSGFGSSVNGPRQDDSLSGPGQDYAPVTRGSNDNGHGRSDNDTLRGEEGENAYRSDGV